MREIVGIKEDYIAVIEKNGVTYGGNQGFFRELDDRVSRKKEQNGCGMVALCDIMRYLRYCRNSGMKLFPDRASYREYFDQMCRETRWHPLNCGMSSLMLVWRFNHICKKQGLRMHGKWGWNTAQIVNRTSKMLQMDMPVILCIPMMILPWQKKHQMNLYQYEKGRMYVRTATQGHYVVITGIVEENSEAYFRISSWGKMYYLPVGEYLKFVKEHFFGNVLGNIMYLKIENNLDENAA